MQKRVCLLLTVILSLSVSAVSAQTFTPQPDMAQEILIRTTFTDVPTQFSNVNRLQTMAALQLMTFSDNRVHLQQYMTEDEVLRILYYAAGVRDKADQMGENNAYRTEMGLGERDAASNSDGLYLYAYQSGLISKEQFDGYFFTYALSRNTVAMRYDVYLWMAKLFGIQPESDFGKLIRFSDGNRIQTADKPYFAALINQGLVEEKTSLGLYFPVSREWFLNTLERMEPYFIETLGYQKREGTVIEVLQDEAIRKIVVETSGGGQDVIEVPLSKTQNQLAEDIAVLGAGGRQITACLTAGETISYYIKNAKVSFIVVKNALPNPLVNTEVQVEGTLYYYDPDMRMAAIQTASGYIPVFLAENVSITNDDTAIAAVDLCQYYGKTIQVSAIMRYEKDLLTAKSCRVFG